MVASVVASVVVGATAVTGCANDREQAEDAAIAEARATAEALRSRFESAIGSAPTGTPADGSPLERARSAVESATATIVYGEEQLPDETIVLLVATHGRAVTETWLGSGDGVTARVCFELRGRHASGATASIGEAECGRGLPTVVEIDSGGAKVDVVATLN